MDNQNIVLIEINNGDYVEAEAFKNIDSFNDWLKDTFPKQFNALMKQQKNNYNEKTNKHCYKIDHIVINAYINYTLF